MVAGVVLSALTATVATCTVGASAQPPTTTPPAPPSRLALTSQPAWTRLGGEAPFHLDVTGPLAGLELRVTVHQSVITRSGFDRTLAGQSLGRVLTRTLAVTVEELPTDEAGHRVLTLGLQDPAGAGDSRGVAIPRTGIYPVEFELRDRDVSNTLDHFVTYLVAIAPTASGPAIPEPLSVSWIWRMVAQPAYQANGQPDRNIVRQLQRKGRLGRMAAALARTDSVPITLAPGPETLEAWKALADQDSSVAGGVEAVTAAAQANQVLGGPYVPVDVPALDAHRLGSEVAQQLALGADTLNAALGVRIDPRTALVDRVDAGALARLREAGVDRLVVEPETLQPVDSPLTPARPFDLESEGRTFRAAANDSVLSGVLEGTDPPALRAQRLLAGLALVALEQPGEARGIMLTSPAQWSPPEEMLDAVTNGLLDHPLLEPVSVDTFLETVPAAKTRSGTPLVRQLLPSSPGSVPVSVRAYRDAEQSLASFRSLVPADDPRIARGHRALLVSLSSAWTGAGGRARAAAELFVIETAVGEFLSKVHAPDGRTVTITARTASIPITLTNDTGRPVRVRVELSSNKLFFPRGSRREIELPPKTRTVEFAVTTRASGAFPVLVKITSTDGRLKIQTARLTVRSTVVSGVGLFLTIGAGLFLAAWWLNHFRRNRRRPRRSSQHRGTARPEGHPT